jgi:hypothetical protein
LIIDARERSAPLGASKVIFRLNIAPSAIWSQAFDHSPLKFDGPGTLDYLNLPRPTINGDQVNWIVPTNTSNSARGYVQQCIDHANTIAPVMEIMAVEEPSGTGGQWHAMEIKSEGSHSATTMCTDVVPSEHWNIVDCWIQSGDRRCNRCSFLAEKAGHPNQVDMKRAQRNWENDF